MLRAHLHAQAAGSSGGAAPVDARRLARSAGPAGRVRVALVRLARRASGRVFAAAGSAPGLPLAGGQAGARPIRRHWPATSSWSSDLEPFALIRDALRLGAYHLGRDGSQLGAQLRGRLDRGRWPEVDRLLDSLAEFETGPRLRLRSPVPDPPGRRSSGHSQGTFGPHRGAGAGARRLRARLRDLPMARCGCGTWPRGRSCASSSATPGPCTAWPSCRVWIAWCPPPRIEPSGCGISRPARASRCCMATTRRCAEWQYHPTAAVRRRSARTDWCECGTSAHCAPRERSRVRFTSCAASPIHPMAARIVFGAGDGTLRVLDAASHREVRRIEGQQAIFSALAIDAAGRSVLAGADDGSLGIWDFDSGSQTRYFRRSCQECGRRGLRPGRELVVSGGGDRVVRVWDIDTARLTHAFDGHSGSVRSVAVPSTRPCVFSASGDRTVRCWHVAPSHHRADVIGRNWRGGIPRHLG